MQREAEIVAHAGEAGRMSLLQPIWQVVVPILNLTPESVDAGGLYILGTERHESQTY